MTSDQRKPDAETMTADQRAALGALTPQEKADILRELLTAHQYEDLSGLEFCICCGEPRVDGCKPDCRIAAAIDANPDTPHGERQA